MGFPKTLIMQTNQKQQNCQEADLAWLGLAEAAFVVVVVVAEGAAVADDAKNKPQARPAGEATPCSRSQHFFCAGLERTRGIQTGQQYSNVSRLATILGLCTAMGFASS